MNTDRIEDRWEQQQKEQRRLAFERYAEQFFNAWQPADPLQCARFHAELFTLVRQIYIDAQAPLFEQLRAIVSAFPLAPPFHLKPPGGATPKEGVVRGAAAGDPA